MAEPERVEQVEYGDSPVYRWTIRGLYAVAIALNVWLLWQSAADDVETQIVKARIRQVGNRILAPFHLERRMQKETGPVIWEATQIVEGARGAAADD